MNKRFLLRLQLVIVTAMFSSVLYAHPGHDHHHWTSVILHVLFYASLTAAAAACGYAGYKAIQRNRATRG
ncbi:hypothetical protein [Alteromonas sp. C1M14]|uniref:hypothetical protein n=1 Tax=Alteromonas sp. C1M14 TaxID=2841567 RepID=UPI001C088063|nr:hypothetical protein [Alteromonas sp. C1M14]MBU2979913.1 hypothetical protein [Alteromonas sp. C1M14]